MIISMNKLLFFVLVAILPVVVNANHHFRIKINTVCDPAEMSDLSLQYLQHQVDHNWNPLFAHFHPDIIVTTNVLKSPSTVGKVAAETLYSSIGFVFQSIDAIIEGPYITYNSTTVVSLFKKLQRSLTSNFSAVIEFRHSLTFAFENGTCWVMNIDEFADEGKTGELFSFEFGAPYASLCVLIDKFLCVNNPVNYGQDQTCFSYWKDAPESIRDDQLRLIIPSKSLICVRGVMSQTAFNSAACFAFGLPPFPGAIGGCWN
jgi:hypothetical protein